MKNIKTSLLVCLLSISFWARAAEMCVTTATELRSALNIAEGNSEHDVVKIAQGIYETSVNGFYYQEKLGWDLEISGGWREVLGNPCGEQLIDPLNTILDGRTTTQVLGIRSFGVSSLTVSNIAFINGYTEQIPGAGLQVTKVDNLNLGVITVENNIFINNESDQGAAMYVFGANEIIVRNNLITANHANVNYAVSTGMNNGYGTYFTNNTVISNTAGSIEPKGVYIINSEPSQLLVANNVLQDNGDLDLEVVGPGAFYFKHNNFGNKYGFAIEDVGNFSLPSRFESGVLSYTPSLTSPLVNAGIKPCTICPIPVPFDETWSLGSVDLAGGARTKNGVVDIGAYESDYQADLIFWNRFD